MAGTDKEKNCLYPTPAACGEVARFAPDSALCSYVEKGVEGYDLIYIADTHEKQVFLLGTAQGLVGQTEIDPTQPVHEQAHQKAALGEVVRYEWSAACKSGNCFFQSVLIPLRDKQGKIGSILGLVKDITNWAKTDHHAQFLKEVSQRTFPQVLLMAREEERRNLSSALHDEIGSSAVILTSLLSMVKESVKSQDKTQALKDIAALDKQIKNSIERIKNIVVSMRPPNLETVGLQDALRDMVENAAHYGNLTHSFSFKQTDDLPASDEVNIVLYRVVQESLNNILKHAQATQVDVLVESDASEMRVSIKDNGKGFVPEHQQSIEHIGLLSMKDSVAYLGGKFTIISEQGKGTLIKVSCPKVVYGEKNR